MINVKEFVALVGRRHFARSFGHAEQVISRAIKSNEFPAAWYRDIRDWCVRNQIDPPEHLFKWAVKPVSNHDTKQNANSPSIIQGGDCR